MKTFFTCFFLLFSIILLAQVNENNQWAWINGDTTANMSGVYGIQGQASIDNKPGARSNSVTWKDRNGNLWLFGGIGYGSTGSGVGYLNDLWKYDPNINQWTWVKGKSLVNDLGTYGPKGVPNSAYLPAARKGAISWTDLFGNLWLFGGRTTVDLTEAYLNDLWEFDPISNQWTFVSGDNTINSQGIYGTKGTPDKVNKPSGRESSVSWGGDNGILWLFGGYGNGFGGDNSNLPLLNDLWKYDIASNQWTWMSGADYLQGKGYYGTQGTSALANTPGARFASASWKDISGNMWLFGGNGYATNSTTGLLNDLWKYEPLNNQWTWVKGDIIIKSKGLYGTRGIAALGNKPGAREYSIARVDSLGNFLLYEGVGFPSSGLLCNLNDLWEYNTSTNFWTWLKGDSIANILGGVYGSYGTASPLNKPGARNSSVSWSDAMGNLVLFGGYGYATRGINTYLNDLWKLSPYTTLPVTYISTSTKCSNGNVEISWQTAQEANLLKYEIEKSNGSSWIIIGSVNGAGNRIRSNNYTFTDLTYGSEGLYRIAEIDKDGRKVYSPVLRSLCPQLEKLKVWPNPVTTHVTIQSSTKIDRIQVFNEAGILMEDITPTKNNYNLNLSNFSPGSYLLRLETGKQIINRKIIKN